VVQHRPLHVLRKFVEASRITLARGRGGGPHRPTLWPASARRTAPSTSEEARAAALGARLTASTWIPGIVSLAWLALVVVSAREGSLARSYALGPRMKQAHPHGTRRLVGAAGGVGDVPPCRGWG
jgi:hypothetical protein